MEFRDFIKGMKQIDSEKLVERKLGEYIKAKGGLSIKLLSSSFNGLPDRMCLLPGGHVHFVELKTTGKKPRPTQVAVHRMFAKLGFEVAVLDSVQAVREYVEQITK